MIDTPQRRERTRRGQPRDWQRGHFPDTGGTQVTDSIRATAGNLTLWPVPVQLELPEQLSLELDYAPKPPPWPIWP